MPRRQTQNTKRKARYFTDEEEGICHLPKQLGRGANIRIITPDGAVVQSNPAAYKKLGNKQRKSVVGGICAALGIEMEKVA